MAVIEKDKTGTDIESLEFREKNRVAEGINAYAIGHLLGDGPQIAPVSEEEQIHRDQARLERNRQHRIDAIIYAPLYPIGLIFDTCDAIKNMANELLSRESRD